MPFAAVRAPITRVRVRRTDAPTRCFVAAGVPIGALASARRASRSVSQNGRPCLLVVMSLRRSASSHRHGIATAMLALAIALLPVGAMAAGVGGGGGHGSMGFGGAGH